MQNNYTIKAKHLTIHSRRLIERWKIEGKSNREIASLLGKALIEQFLLKIQTLLAHLDHLWPVLLPLGLGGDSHLNGHLKCSLEWQRHRALPP